MSPPVSEVNNSTCRVGGSGDFRRLPWWLSWLKNPPAVWEAWVQSLGWEDPLEKGTGYPVLENSGLENSMDCIVHGVPKSGAWVSDFHLQGKQLVPRVYSVTYIVSTPVPDSGKTDTC